jgi:hypothetical protein
MARSRGSGGIRHRLQYRHTVRTRISTSITIGPSITGLRGTQLTGSIIYTLVTWGELCSLVEDIELEDIEERISWQWEPSGSYSSRSLYLEFCKRPEVHVTKYFWSYAIPLKIKIFTWQLACSRVLTNDQIFARRGPSDGKCALCGEVEHADHIFFQCPLAQFVWSGVREMFSVSWNPRSRIDWFQILDSLSEWRGSTPAMPMFVGFRDMER